MEGMSRWRRLQHAPVGRRPPGEFGVVPLLVKGHRRAFELWSQFPLGFCGDRVSEIDGSFGGIFVTLLAQLCFGVNIGNRLQHTADSVKSSHNLRTPLGWNNGDVAARPCRRHAANQQSPEVASHRRQSKPSSAMFASPSRAGRIIRREMAAWANKALRFITGRRSTIHSRSELCVKETGPRSMRIGARSGVKSHTQPCLWPGWKAG